ncbi:hypothetical protein HDU93_004415, partial [Gonapodya sp. JEL0774]
NAKRRVLEAVRDGGVDTVRTPVFDVMRGIAWPAGYDGRVLRNEVTRSVEKAREREKEGGASGNGPSEVDRELSAWAKRYPSEVARGNYNVGVVFAGAGAGMIRGGGGRGTGGGTDSGFGNRGKPRLELPRAEDLVTELVEGAVKVLEKAGGWAGDRKVKL